MSTKPTVVTPWAASGLIVTPSGGKQAAGFVVGEAPCAQHLNWLHNAAGLWEQWLLDGDCQFHNLSATGTITAAVNQNMIVSGTGRYSGQSVNTRYSSALALAGAGVTKTIGGDVGGSSPTLAFGTSTAASTLPLAPLVGTTITGYSAQIVKISGSGTISVKLLKVTGTGSTAVQVGATQTSSSGVQIINLGQTGLTEAVAANTTYYIYITGGGSTGDVMLYYDLTHTT